VEETNRKKRAELRRQQMTITHCRLEDSDIDPQPIFGAEAISLAAVISRQAWAFSGRPFPSYKRSEIPVRFIDHDSE